MKKQILVVEDENDCAELLKYHLQKENYETVIARNGKEAIEAVQRHMPDAVLLDVMMPELNGWEVCRILRESTKGKSLPIIMITALSEEEERVKGLSLGADDYISKPYSVRELLLKIKKHIDRQQMIKQLMEREQEQDTTLRYIVHEVKNSLHVIGGFSSHVLRKDESNKYLKTIYSTAFRAEKMLNDASLRSRLEARGESPSTEKADIGSFVSEPDDFRHGAATTAVEHQQISAASLISEIAETTRILIGKKPVSVEVATPLMDVMIETDNVKLRQILTNLVSNAAKYTEQGKIVITLSVIGSWIGIAVSDTGVGMKEEDLHKLFTTYSQIKDSSTKKQEGMGVGLKISKDLAALLRGTISVTSSYGKGTTFVVSLPLQRADSQRELYSVE